MSLLKSIVTELANISERIETIQEAIQKLEKQNGVEGNTSMLTQSEACQLFDMSISTLRRRREEGMPYIKTGKKIYFNKVEVEKWLNKNKE